MKWRKRFSAWEGKDGDISAYVEDVGDGWTASVTGRFGTLSQFGKFYPSAEDGKKWAEGEIDRIRSAAV
jgi:hypothetical protein